MQEFTISCSDIDKPGDCATNDCMCQVVCAMDDVIACEGCWMYCDKNPNKKGGEEH